uniref:ankyrin repeat and SAM domain-containing protein 6-like isoform X2 n=1 Tax=Ciona intestinalis TaxID=7719 RepID=UPI00089DC02E|nr:ankyrin repeat and SAM domain-containing protein 6-like isoform X2 [Ciona intestinalis]|eukprot:XP_018666877.1 ankyrin repeat and SAM domain-containing protein 6-like isoform X2 [Ciona intestinalis]
MDNSSITVPQSIWSLLKAVEDGDANKVQHLLEQNTEVSVETTDADGNSLLHIAAANGHEEVVRILLIKGASLDRSNSFGWTPLMQAARYGNESVAHYLLNNKAKINVTTPMGISALTLATYGGHTKMIELFMNHDVLADDSESVPYFTSPLAVATMQGRDDNLKKLLKKGIPPDQYFKFTDWTPLMIAALTGQLPMAKLLVEKGANPNFKNKQGKTALEIATDCEMKEVRGYLDHRTTDKPARVTESGESIIAAVKKGDYQKVFSLLEADGGKANKASSDGATPLMYASITGQLNLIKLLLDYNADIDARDYENGWTALMQATYYGKTQAAIYLIRRGANVGIQAHNGVTAFDMAMLINLNDTTLFRLLAEKVMQGYSNDEGGGCESTQLTKAWQSTGSGSLLAGAQSQVTKPTSTSNQSGVKRNWLSKVSMKMKGMKLTRTFKTKTSTFDETLIAPDDTVPDANSKFDTNGGSNVTIGDPYAMAQANHCAPTTHFPMEKFSPVVPPFQSATGVDKQTMSSQRKLSSSKTSISNSLNSSGESSASLVVVRPFKFLQSPNSSGRYNGGNGPNGSPHSSGGATSVTRSFNHKRNASIGVKEPHNTSGDRHSDTVLANMTKRKQRKNTSSTPSSVVGGSMRSAMSAEQLTTSLQKPLYRYETQNRKKSSRAGSVASSQSTSSSRTLTPPQSPKSGQRSEKSRRSEGSRGARSVRSQGSSFSTHPSLSEEDELSGILRKLSLENYHPIFEEQEINMDDFLTLTHGDLSELGITQELPRQQILQAIKQINNRKEKKLTNSRPPHSKRPGSLHTVTSWSYNTTQMPHIQS